MLAKPILKPAALGLLLVAAAFAYWGLAHAGLVFATLNRNASPVWPASGFALALLSRYGISNWPAVFLGALFANWGTAPPSAVVAIACGNSLEAILGALLLRNLPFDRYFVFHARSFGVLASGLLASPVAAFVGVGSLVLSGTVPAVGAHSAWLTWCVGDILGIWMVFPLLNLALAKMEDWKRRDFWKSVLQCFGLGAPILIAISFFSFVTWNGTILFLAFPLLLLVSENYERFTIHFAAVILSTVAIIATSSGYGPFQGGSLNQNLLNLQFFLSSVAIAALVLGDLKGHIVLRETRIVLLGGWLLSGLLFLLAQQWERERDATRLDAMVGDAEQRLVAKMNVYENALRGGASLFVASYKVESREWNRYATALQLPQRFPGIHGIGHVEQIPKSKLASWLKRTNAHNARKGLPPMQLRSVPYGDGQGKDHYLITMVEPAQGNEGVLGLDLATEKNRRESADKARETRQLTVSDNIVLVQDKKKRAGFLAYTPIFDPDRRGERSFLGWVYAPFITEDFFQGALGSLYADLNVTLLDSIRGRRPVVTVGEKVSNRTGYDRVTEVILGQRRFALGWRRTDLFLERNQITSALFGALSAVLTLFLAGSMTNLRILNQKAAQLANERTLQLRLLFRTTELLAKAGSANEVISAAAEVVRQELHWRGFVFWRYDDDATQLVVESTSLNLVGEMTGKTLTLNSELPFRALVSGRPRWITDVAQEGKTPRALAAERLGLQGAVALPIRSGDKMRGILEFFTPAIGELEPSLLGTLAEIGTRIGERLDKLEADQSLIKKEQRLIQTSKMSALGEMSGGIAHEINNPLAIIHGRASLLKQSAQDSTLANEDVIRSMDTVLSTVERIAKIIRGLRAFARHSEADPFADVPISQIVQNTLELCSERFRSHEVSLYVSELPDVSVRCREAQISQVLLNLLNNAFDAVREREDRWVRIDVVRVEDRMELSVTDSGPGIRTELADKITEPFFTTKPVGQGTGLGLSISLGIVQEHRGTLALDRKSPNTRFIVSLPASAGAV